MSNRLVTNIVFDATGEIQTVTFSDGKVMTGPLMDSGSNMKNVVMQGATVHAQGSLQIGDSYSQITPGGMIDDHIRKVANQVANIIRYQQTCTNKGMISPVELWDDILQETIVKISELFPTWTIVNINGKNMLFWS